MNLCVLNPSKSCDRTILDCLPMPGLGKRAMGCDKYDACLYKAAVADWDSFNCDACQYEGRGALEFIDPVYLPEAVDDSFFDDLESDLVELVFSLKPAAVMMGEQAPNDHAA